MFSDKSLDKQDLNRMIWRVVPTCLFVHLYFFFGTSSELLVVGISSSDSDEFESEDSTRSIFLLRIFHLAILEAQCPRFRSNPWRTFSYYSQWILWIPNISNVNIDRFYSLSPFLQGWHLPASKRTASHRPEIFDGRNLQEFCHSTNRNQLTNLNPKPLLQALTRTHVLP